MHSRCLNYVCLELNTAYMLQNTNRLHISRALTREKLTPLGVEVGELISKHFLRLELSHHAHNLIIFTAACTDELSSFS